MTYESIIAWLQHHANAANVAGMDRYGIRPAHAYGISMKDLAPLVKRIGKDHALALRLWAQGSHETRILATDIADPCLLTREQAEDWALGLDSWAIGDTLCMHLLWKTPFAYDLAFAWSARPEEYVKRAAFALMAKLAVSDKKAPPERIASFLPIIRREAVDNRPMVRKAVSWALRQIGKRNLVLHAQALETAHAILADATPSGTWIAKDALRELESPPVRRRLGLP